MKRYWSDNEMDVTWRIWPDEEQFLQSKTGASKLGCALLLKFFQYSSRFPSNLTEIPPIVVKFVAAQIGVKSQTWPKYSMRGRTAELHRANIGVFCGFRKATMVDGQNLEDWLVNSILNHEYKPERLQEAAFGFFREHRIDPPGPERMKRLLTNAVNHWEGVFCTSIFQQLPSTTINGFSAGGPIFQDR